jgi:pimeloyl-ACP methyl ester carboxylesterase
MIVMTQALAAATKFIWPIPDKGLRRRLHRVRAPSLAIFGAEDAYVPARYAEDFAAGLSARTAIIAGAGHMLTYEKPDEVMRHIGSLVQIGRTTA